MANLYIKSIILLVSSGGFAYVLMKITEPSKEKLDKIRASSSSTCLTEEQKKKVLFLQRMRQSAYGEPIYLKTKGEQDRQTEKEVPEK